MGETPAVRGEVGLRTRCGVSSTVVMRGMFCSTRSTQFFHEYLRAPIPVVFFLAYLWQPFSVDLFEAAFDNPMHGARRQYEYRLDSERLCAMFDALQNPLAVALALNLRRYRQRRQFGGAGFRKRIQR